MQGLYMDFITHHCLKQPGMHGSDLRVLLLHGARSAILHWRRRKGAGTLAHARQLRLEASHLGGEVRHEPRFAGAKATSRRCCQVTVCAGGGAGARHELVMARQG